MINVFAAQPRKLPQYWWALSLARGAVGSVPSQDQHLKVWLLRGTEWWVWEHPCMWCRLSKLHRSSLWFHAELPSLVWETSYWLITEKSHTSSIKACVSSHVIFWRVFTGGWEEQISGGSTAAQFDLSKEHVIRIPTAAFCTQPSLVSMRICQNKSRQPNNVKISLGQARFSERIISFCSKSTTKISPSQLDTSVQRAWSHGATRITWSSTSAEPVSCGQTAMLQTWRLLQRSSEF